MKTGKVQVAAGACVPSETPMHAAAWAQELALAGVEELGAALLCVRGVVPRGTQALLGLARQTMTVAGVRWPA